MAEKCLTCLVHNTGVTNEDMGWILDGVAHLRDSYHDDLKNYSEGGEDQRDIKDCYKKLIILHNKLLKISSHV